MAPGAFKPEPVANAKFQHMRNSTTIGAYKERWTHAGSKSKNAWYDDLGNEIKFGLFMFRDPLDFVFPAATTSFKQRRRDVVGQAIPVKRLPPTVPIATKTPPAAPPAIPAPTATTPGAASVALEPSATTRAVRAKQAQKSGLMDTGAPIVVSTAATKAKKPSKSEVAREKKSAKNKKEKERQKRVKANTTINHVIFVLSIICEYLASSGQGNILVY